MRNRKMIILSIALIVVMLGFGMVIPIFPFYIEEMGAGGLEMGLLVATASLLEFVFGPFWGNLSDRKGRKPILLVGMIGYALSTFLFGIASRLWMVFASRAVSGILSSAVVTTALAYVSDTTSDQDKAGGMGQLSAAMAFGMIFGPALGGLLGSRSMSLPFFIASAFSVFAFLIIFLFLPESLPKSIRHSQPNQITKKVSRWAKIWTVVVGKSGFLFFLLMLYSFALANFEAVFGLYALEKFSLNAARVGFILTVVAVVSTIGKALLCGPLTRKYGEPAIIKSSLIAGAVGYLGLISAVDYLTILFATGFFILSKTLLRPASLALIAKQNHRQQGTLMGISNAFISLGRILGPIWAGFVFDRNVEFPYLSGSIFMLIAFLISLRTLPPYKKPN